MPGMRLPLNVRAALDTASPISDRPFGTLVEAWDLSPRFWGPRRGSKRFTGPWEGPGTASLYDAITLTTGGDTRGIGRSYEESFRDVGTAWTLDLWFRVTSVAHGAAATRIGLYSFVVGNDPTNRGLIEVAVAGGVHATPGRLLVDVYTTPTRTTFDSLKSIVGSTAFSVGSTQIDKHHVRLVRDGGTMTLYLDGVSDGSNSNLVATSGILGPVNSEVLVGLGSISGLLNVADLAITHRGSIYGAVLRDGAFSQVPIEARMPANPWARNIHHYYLGRNYALAGSADHFFDAGRFGAHARISGSNYSVTSSNDDQPPAPAPTQGMATWVSQKNRVVSSVMTGGLLNSALVG